MSYLTETECVAKLAERIGCQGLGGWLFTLGQFLSFPSPFPPEKAVRFHDAASPTYGIKVRLHYPAWETTEKADPYGWVLYGVTFDATKSELPFYLDSRNETPASAQKRLSTDTNWFPPNVTTYFLPDNRVVAITFHPNLVGISTVQLNRLYQWPDWRKVSKKKKK